MSGLSGNKCHQTQSGGNHVTFTFHSSFSSPGLDFNNNNLRQYSTHRRFSKFHHVTFSARNNSSQAPLQQGSISSSHLADVSESSDTVVNLVNSYKRYGHYLAVNVNPIVSQRETDGRFNGTIKEIAARINLLKKQVEDENSINISGLIQHPQDAIPGSQLIHLLESTYGEKSNVSVEFMHIPDPIEREWISREFERLRQQVLPENEKKDITKLLLESQVIETFFGKKFPSVKRYSGEGAESMNVFFHKLFHSISNGSEIGKSNVFIGMPHRGRLALMATLLNYPPSMLFHKMAGHSEVDFGKFPSSTGDVLSHLYTSVLLNEKVQVTLLPNPSHLEAVSPVTVGSARAIALKDDRFPYSVTDKDMSPLAVQVHGDGSFSGQGIVMETLAMSRLPGFHMNGSIHLIVNNQLEYTTPAMNARSSAYSSDPMKIIDSPIIHVDGLDPFSVAMVADLALNYRNLFKKDILVDMVCFRKYGHNELDDPFFTNPLIYKEIKDLSKKFPEKFSRRILEEDEYQSIRKNYETFLNSEFQKSQNASFALPSVKLQANNLEQPSRELITIWNTGFQMYKLKEIGLATVKIPSDFMIHPTLKKSLVLAREETVTKSGRIDWSMAEAMAIGSLMNEGVNVRISGQDVGRGTFSQRHAILTDQNTGDTIVPLNDCNLEGRLEVVNSLLSEEAVLGFEYGFSIISPEKNLSIWEAQFGDFFNGAQIIIDTMISSGELKWNLQTNLVMLLPHGMDGAGPEHSSCRLERFLQMSDSKISTVDSDDVNMVIVNPTTPAQYFHLLRRQMIRNFKKPLIVAAPKILLRHPEAVSSFEDLSPGTFFKPVIDDSFISDPQAVKKLIFCSGKHYYALNQERIKKSYSNIAIVRIEELCPFPAPAIIDVLHKYSKASKIIWSQEEHENQGCWSHVFTRFHHLLKRPLTYAGRGVLGSPATGISDIHKKEAAEIIETTFSK